MKHLRAIVLAGFFLLAIAAVQYASAQTGGSTKVFLPLVEKSNAVLPSATPSPTSGTVPTAVPHPTVAATPVVPGVVQYAITNRAHITGTITYDPLPPVGGNHWPIWLNCGFYDQPVHDQEGTHSMEHGAVWITYRPDLPAADIATLRQLAGSATSAHVIFSPYTNIPLPAPVVASAWDYQLYLTGVSDPRLVQFINTYKNNPFSGEPNGECSGGDGNPNPANP